MSSDKRFDLLAHAVEIANSTVDINERLENMMRAASQYLGARASALFKQNLGHGDFIISNLWPGGCLKPDGLSPVDMDQGQLADVARTRQPKLFESPCESKDAVLCEICTPNDAAAVFPVQDDNRLYALLVFVMPKGLVLPRDDIRLLQMVAREMAGTIRNFRLYFEAKKRIAELYVISDLGRAAVSTIEINELLTTVAVICAKFLGAEGCMVQLGPINIRGTRMTATHGKVPDQCHQGDLCLSFCSVPSHQGKHIQSRLCTPEDSIESLDEALCTGMQFKGDYQGNLCVFHKLPLPGAGSASPAFTEDDKNLLNTMASMVSPALENAMTFQRIEELAQRNEEMVSEIATLFEISTILMTTVDFNETVQIVLHAVTHPAGLDHDRVLMFLVDEAKGVMTAMADMLRPAGDSRVCELNKALQRVRNRLPLPGGGIWGEEQEPLEISLDPKKSVLARTVEEKRPILVDDPVGRDDVAPKLIDALGPHTFVTVPMFAKGKVVGLMVVNNGLDDRSFNDRDIKLLTMLANLGGLAVENARLYSNLERANHELAVMRNRLLEADKLAALGEIAAGVAHEIRNPLVSIGGFTRRIRKKVGDASEIRTYLDVIIEEVTRLENTLNEMLDFSSDNKANLEEQDLTQIMDDALDLVQRDLDDLKIEVERSYSEALPKIYVDDRQIKHVFFNLYLNAIQAMQGPGGRLTLRTFTLARDGKQFVAGEVIDSGGGIALDVIHNIFNPFFTTKDTGTGLGLSIAHKIVTRHYGAVEVHNHEGRGAVFQVTLPAAEEGRAYLK
jgi:two-component system sensor histidine kinase HydH